MVPQKHKEASKFKYNSGFFITTNIYPDFGDERDAEAVRKRLCIFNTKALPRKDNTVTGKLCFAGYLFKIGCIVNEDVFVI